MLSRRSRASRSCKSYASTAFARWLERYAESRQLVPRALNTKAFEELVGLSAR
jgi:hypothetical protein